jgi:ABC-type nitrate/sulfonate/bicarbonate transport system substrate-binding protein
MTPGGYGASSHMQPSSTRPKEFTLAKRIRHVLLILMLGAGLTAPCLGEDLDKVSIQLKWLHQFQFAGYYAAKAKGFYEEAGLDVELIERGPESSPVEAVVNGDAEYGVSDAGLLLARDRGEPVVLLAQIFQYSPVVFLTLRESGLRTPYDLAGKRLMTDDAGENAAALKAMLAATLAPDQPEINWAEHTYDNYALLTGEVDAMLAYRTNEPFWSGERDVQVNTIDPRDYGARNRFCTASPAAPVVPVPQSGAGRDPVFYGESIKPPEFARVVRDECCVLGKGVAPDP